MRKNVLLVLFLCSIVSCKKDLTTDLALQFPKYHSSKEAFLKTITVADSLSVGSGVHEESNLFTNSVNSVLLITIYTDDEKKVGEAECKTISTQIKNKETGIANLHDFDVIKYVNHHNELLFEERIAK